MRLLTSDSVTAIDCHILRGNRQLSCGLITVDRFVRSPITLNDAETGDSYVIQLPSELEAQPVMTSLPNVKLQIKTNDPS
jgi:hypothetical protein